MIRIMIIAFWGFLLKETTICNKNTPRAKDGRI